MNSVIFGICAHMLLVGVAASVRARELVSLQPNAPDHAPLLRGNLNHVEYWSQLHKIKVTILKHESSHFYDWCIGSLGHVLSNMSTR